VEGKVERGEWNEARARGAFRRRIGRGDYGRLLEKPLQAVVRQAAAERSLDEEMAALRIAAKRLLLEEEDPARMALGLSRVTTALGRLLTQEQELVERRRGARNEERETRSEGRGVGSKRGVSDAEAAVGEGEQGMGKRRTNRAVVEEWRAQGGEARALRTETGVGVGEDEIVDLFSELRPGGWRYELADGEG
jgi:hypothetical protein